MRFDQWKDEQFWQDLLQKADKLLGKRWVKRLLSVVPTPMKVLTVLKATYERQGKDSGLDHIAKDLFGKSMLFSAFLTALVKGEYRDVEVFTLVKMAAAIVYFVSPFDLIPDAIPIIGYLDDILLLSWLIKTLDHELARFEKWQEENQVFPETSFE